MDVTAPKLEQALGSALAPFVMTSAFEDRRTGVVVKNVLQCADEPLLICVAARKGHWIEPLIRDSRVFAVCRLDPEDRLARRRFADDRTEDQGDPFDGLPVSRLKTGAPILDRSTAVLDCEVVRHFDLEADHELYIGQVLAVKLNAPD